MAIRLQYPLRGGPHPMTSPFGWRSGFWENGVYVRPMLHNGQDYGAPAGTPILAAANGSVVFAGWDASGGGNSIRLTHGNFDTMYLHMLRPTDLKFGEQVRAGQVIGYVGSTGLSTGAHLHFMLGINGTWVNPVPYLNSSVPSAPAAPSDDSEEITVETYQNRQNEIRKIKKGETLWLTHPTGPNRGKKQNTVASGAEGRAILTAHVYGDGFAEGDSVFITYSWQDIKTGAESFHYTEMAVANRNGEIRKNVTFQRNVTSKQRVFLKVYASSNNKATGTLSRLESDSSVLRIG